MYIDSIGIDKGSVLTKDSNRNVFKSIVAPVKDNFKINQHEIFKMDDKKFYVGDHALNYKYDFATDLAKTTQYNTKVCIYYALANNHYDKYLEYNLVNLGLPIGKYFRFKDTYRKLLNVGKQTEVILGSNRKLIKINDIQVLPESSGFLYGEDVSKFSNEKVIAIDIGGLSVDVSVYRNCNITDGYDSFNLGILPIYDKIANSINNIYYTDFSAWDMESKFENGLFIQGRNETETFKSIYEPLFKERSEEIYKKVKLITNLTEARYVLLGGGGSEQLKDYIKELIPQSYQVNNYCFGNAEIFNEIGKVMSK
ncbi:ParM/StbA family protein [Clostridium sp. D2Q-11]|uniref:ParM/StbA family protein n=1 Tax=Anaeromonas frigoriresistens TaxID=2683708 RepID=A0A942UWB6_9FIRM|nr:ParM/StbA family protein [Anaeromonas frigoriresistens]MBS4539788.1 ParM/StbA family protein [Anaeromonas frigoriresistens]